MIAELIARLGPWAWIILGVVLVGLELPAPGVFLVWLGLAAVATGLIDAALSPVLAGRDPDLRRPVRRCGPGRAQPQPARWCEAGGRTPRQPPRRGARRSRLRARGSRSSAGEGRVRVDDSFWRVTGPDAPAGASVRVVRVEGTTLVVEAS